MTRATRQNSTLRTKDATGTYVQYAGAGQATQVSTSADATTRQLVSSTPAAFGPISGTGLAPVIVDPGSEHQPILGFGAAVTGATAYVLRKYLTAAQRTALLTELFSPSGLNLATILVPMGSSDFDAADFTYDDQPLGSTDASLTSFSVKADEADKIPIIQEILRINPRVKVIASPWSPPAWMKTTPAVGISPGNGNSGNTLSSSYFAAYAQYFVKFIQAYAAHGIPIWAVSPQNEPQSGSQGWPCLSMSAADQITFIGTHLGPALEAAGIASRIICFKQNWGGSSYPDTVLADATASSYIDGVGWHWYSSQPEGTQSLIARKYPTKAQYFLEACDSPSRAGTMANYYRYIFTASMRAGSRIALLWNIALDENGRPNTRQDGVPLHGLVTVPSSGSGVLTRTADYYALAQTSKFVAPGAVRIGSPSSVSGVMTAAYANPDGTIVLVTYNAAATASTVQIIDARTGQGFPVTLPAGEVSTFTWRGQPTGSAVNTIATPSAPTATATAATDAITLSWTAPSPGGAPISGYVISAGSTAGALSPIATVGAADTTYTDTGAARGSATYYSVAAVNSGGVGTASATVSATPTASDSRPATPSTLTRPQLWLRSDLITGVANGGAVSSWPDASGRGLTAVTQGANAPTLVTAAVNGLPVVRFVNGNGNHLVAPFQHVAENLHFLVVARLPAVSGYYALVSSSTADGSAQADTGLASFFATDSKSVSTQLFRSAGNTTTAGPSNAITTANTPFVYRGVVAPPTGHAVTGYVNGVAGSSATPASYTASTAAGLTLGGVTGSYSTVDIAEVIVLKNPTAAEVHAWTVYLGQVYNISPIGPA